MARRRCWGSSSGSWRRSSQDESRELGLTQTPDRPAAPLPTGGACVRGLAAVRELDPWQITERSPGGLNTVAIFTLPVQKRPALEVDGLEIVASHWLSRE